MLQACWDVMPNANAELSGGSKALASLLWTGRQSVSFSKRKTPAATSCGSIWPSSAKDFQLSELNSCFDCFWFQFQSNVVLLSLWICRMKTYLTSFHFQAYPWGSFEHFPPFFFFFTDKGHCPSHLIRGSPVCMMQYSRKQPLRIWILNVILSFENMSSVVLTTKAHVLAYLNNS